MHPQPSGYIAVTFQRILRLREVLHFNLAGDFCVRGEKSKKKKAHRKVLQVLFQHVQKQIHTKPSLLPCIFKFSTLGQKIYTVNLCNQVELSSSLTFGYTSKGLAQSPLPVPHICRLSTFL